MRRLYTLGMSYVFLVLGLVVQDVWATFGPTEPVPRLEVTPPHSNAAPSSSTGREWFSRIKPRCNSLEAAVAIRKSPPPTGRDGAAFAAACYALAGKIPSARALIDELPASDRSHAAGIVFRIGHPIADQGDDESAGPIMELVLRYQPENFMALYHAGMSQFILGEYEQSGINMRRFLEIYTNDDGWTRNGQRVLRRLAEMKQ